LQHNEQIGELDREFTLAQLHESVGRDRKARESYLKAIRLLNAGSDKLSQLVVHERSAQFFRRRDNELAISSCRAALAIDPSSVGARQVLIDVLLDKGDLQSIDEAERLFRDAGGDSRLDDTGLRTEARILAARGNLVNDQAVALRQQAIESLQRISHPTTVDQLLVAELMLKNGQESAFMKQMTRALSPAGADLGAVIAFLERQGPALWSNPALGPAVELALLTIEEHPGREVSALDIRLKALRAEPRDEDETRNLASLLIDRFAQRCLLRLLSDAERLRLLNQTFKYLVDQKRIDDAARLTKMAPPPAAPPQWGIALATALAQSRSSDHLSEEIEKTIASLQHNHPNVPELDFAIGNLRYMQARYAEAVQLYRSALKKNPDHVLTMNNLALSLAASRNGDMTECFELINRALTLQGRDPLLLDTLAQLQVHDGRPQEAIAALNEALPDSHASEPMILHLAHAYWQAGDEPNARKLFDLLPRTEALDEFLSPVDRQMYQILANQLAKPTTQMKRTDDDVQ
jgi:tetratricopeptide (TPR) repeat protein